MFARAPAALAGVVEVRGVGIARVPSIARARVGVVVDLVAPSEIERLPEPATCKLLGVSLPHLRLDPYSASACAKLRLAARALTGDILVEP